MQGITGAVSRKRFQWGDELNRFRSNLMTWIACLCMAGSSHLYAQSSLAAGPAPVTTAAASEAKANAAAGQQVVEAHMIAPPSDEPHQDLFGAHLQRSMTLLESSNKEQRWPVRVLLYGQSIVGSTSFTTFMETYLQQRYPYADIQFENRAIGGFMADRLVRTSVHDLYPYYPDLLIFHVYGGQKTGELERIISNVRRYTTSDIVLFNDHRARDQEISEASAKYFRYLAAKYDCELVDVSTEWPRYLQEHALRPAQLLRDGVHPSVDGYAVLAQLIERHLKYNPIYSDPWDAKVRLYETKRPLAEGVNDEILLTGDGWTLDDEGVVGTSRSGKLHLEFEGNRVDLIAAHTKGAQAGGTAKILIDGKPPSQNPDTTAITLPSPGPGTWFPSIRRVSHTATLLAEDWTLRITRMNPNGKEFDFEVIGSKTGPDGAGSSTQVFHSNSGRVVIDPSDWMFADIMAIFKQTAPPPVGYEVHWKSIPMYVDTYTAPATTDGAKVYETTLAQGIPNGRHTLDIIPNGDGRIPIEAIQVYRPPLR